MNAPQHDNADEIRARMSQIRSEFRQDVREVVQAAEQLTDWRSYVRSNPWVFMAAAATLGYFAVPPRYAGRHVDEDKLKDLLASSAPAQQVRKSSLLGAAIGLIGPLVMRQAMGIASAKLQEYLAAQRATAAEPVDDDPMVQSRNHPR